MQCRNSPLAKSPPPNLPKIPGVTTPDTGAVENGQEPEKAPNKPGGMCTHCVLNIYHTNNDDNLMASSGSMLHYLLPTVLQAVGKFVVWHCL